MTDDIRDHFIGQVVRGRSFIDIGALWGTVNEKVSVAQRLGATDLGIVDVLPPSHDLWGTMRTHLAGAGFEYEEITANLDRLPDEMVDRADVVHCSGIVYHCPNPLLTITQLRRATREWLVLTSMVVPESIENGAGRLDLGAGGGLFLPHLDGQNLSVAQTYWNERGITDIAGVHVTVDPWDLDDYGPWWWLLTPGTLRNMLLTVGFEVVEDAPHWEGRAHTFLARVREESAPTPPPTHVAVEVPPLPVTPPVRTSGIVRDADDLPPLAVPDELPAGSEHVLGFWADWLASEGGDWPDEFHLRFDPARPLREDLAAEIRQRWSMGSRLTLLDVGAGPLSLLGGILPGYDLRLLAIDPLAPGYDLLLGELGLVPPIRTRYCEMGEVTRLTGEGGAHVVLCRAALERAPDAPATVSELVRATAPGGIVLIEGEIDAAARTGHMGLWQWDLRLDDGRPEIVSASGDRWAIDDIVGDRGSVAVLRDEPNWMAVLIERR